MKRGQLSAIQQLIIFGVVFTIIVGAFLVDYLGALQEESKINACAASVAYADLAKGAGADTTLSCETFYKEELDVEKKEEAMHEVSKLMNMCWRQFGYGTPNPFPSAFTSKLIHCFPCAKFSLPQDIRLTNKELLAYQKEKAVRADGTTFYDILMQGEGVLRVEGEEQLVVGGVDLARQPLGIQHSLARLGLQDTTVDAIFSLIRMSKKNFGVESESMSLPVIQDGKDYVVLYYGISDKAIRELALTNMVVDLTGEKLITPKKVVILPYDDITNAGCDHYLG